MSDINIVLVEPEIPQNTGNIARTCAATGAALHLVRPLGFEIDDRKLRRAGLDYWDKLDITYYDSLDDFLTQHGGDPLFLFSTKAPRAYTEPQYPRGAYLVFGRETRGLPEDFILAHLDTAVRLPMRPILRSLNLSNTVAVAVYEVLRQSGFDGLKDAGKFGAAE